MGSGAHAHRGAILRDRAGRVKEVYLALADTSMGNLTPWAYMALRKSTGL